MPAPFTLFSIIRRSSRRSRRVEFARLIVEANKALASYSRVVAKDADLRRRSSRGIDIILKKGVDLSALKKQDILDVTSLTKDVMKAHKFYVKALEARIMLARAFHTIRLRYFKLGLLSDAAIYSIVQAFNDSQNQGAALDNAMARARVVVANRQAITLAFQTIAETEFSVDMPAWHRTLIEYKNFFKATWVDVVVKRVSEVCSKLDKPSFLNKLPLLDAAVEAARIGRKRFYSQPSKLNRKMRFGAWLLMQARGYQRKDGGLYPGKHRAFAEKLLPRTGGNRAGGWMPRLAVSSNYKEFRQRVKAATTRFIEMNAGERHWKSGNKISAKNRGKGQKAKMVKFLTMAIANGADQMVNRQTGRVKPNPKSDMLRKPSAYWKRQSKYARRGKIVKRTRTDRRTGTKRTFEAKSGGGVRIGRGRVMGSLEKPIASVFVPGTVWRRAVQPYVPMLFQQDRADMRAHIDRKLKKMNRRAGRRGARIGRSLIS